MKVYDFTRSFCEYKSAHHFSWNSRLLKVQKHDNKQNFDYRKWIKNVISIIILINR